MDLEGKQRDALIRSVRYLDDERKSLFLKRLADKPEFMQKVRAAVTTVKKEPERKADPGVPTNCVAEPPAKRCALMPQPPLAPEMLDQGSFGLCSAYAVATAVSQGLGAKYGICIEAGRLLDRWFDKGLPANAQWPHQYAKDLGTFSLKTKDSFFQIRVDTLSCKSFACAAAAVAGCAGFKCVVVVMSMSNNRNHSVVGIRSCRDDTIVCQNSWGPDDQPFVHVNAGTFVMGFWIEPVIVQRDYWVDKVKRSDTNLPVLAEWTYIRPRA